MVERLTGWPVLRWVGLAIAFLALGAWLRGCWTPEPAVVYRDVVVDSADIVRGEPDAQAGLLERLTRPVARPEQRATAPGAAAGDVRAFCLAAGYQPATSDRSAPGEPAPGPAGGVPPDGSDFSTGNQEHPPAPSPTPPTPRLPHGLQPDPATVALIRSGRFDGGTLVLWAVTSAGDLRRETFRVRAPFQFAMAGDSAAVQGYRFWWLKPAASIGLCAAGGYLGARTESAIPVAVGCGLGAAIAVR